MPTRRTFVLLILALLLYLLANQTQVGWIYIMSNSLLGIVVVAWLYSWRALRGVRIRRSFRKVEDQAEAEDGVAWESQSFKTGADLLNEAELLFEDDPIEIRLQVEQTGLKPDFLISGREHCPLAPPADQEQPFFIAGLFKDQPVTLTYQTICDRRGFYAFAEIPLSSKGPFSLVRRRRRLTASNQILVYPQYYPLKQLRLLAHKGFTQKQAVRSGPSGEFMGTREYRSGDSLRHVHWRSTARVGSLIVKELADHDQLTMTLVLDLSAQAGEDEGKFSTFETALRLAATFGYFAAHKKIPVRLVGHSPRWRPPNSDLSWWGALNYLAKVQNDGRVPLEQVIKTAAQRPFVVVLISRPTTAVNHALTTLQQYGPQVLAIYITPDGQPPSCGLAAGPKLETRLVSPWNWTAVVSQL